MEFDKIPPLPTEKPKIRFGYLSDVHKYPSIKNVMQIVHWMWANWTSGGGGGGGQPETVTFKLSDYVTPTEPDSSVTIAGGCEATTNLELWNKVVEAVKAGKKVYLQDKYLSTNNGDRAKHWIDFTYEVDCLNETKRDGDDLMQFTAHGQCIMGGEGGPAIPKLAAMLVDGEFTIFVNIY